MYEEIGSVDQNSLYSDITEAGGLGPAIQAELKAIGSSLSVKKADADCPIKFPFDLEVVRQNQRFSQIKTAKHQRLFMLDFWDRGVCLANGSTPFLSKIAEAIHAWIAEEVSPGELQRHFPFVGVYDKAESHQQGAAAEVERQWQEIHSRIKSDDSTFNLVPVVERAMEVSALRQLFPFTSLSRLCFSRCTGYPFSDDCPLVCSSRWIPRLAAGPTPEQRAALGPIKPYTVTDSKGKFLGEGDAAEVIELIVQHLPPNCGPAIQGTTDNLGQLHAEGE